MLQRLEALESVIHAIEVEGVQDDVVDPLKNSTRLGDTSRMSRGGGSIGIDSNPLGTSNDLPIKPVRPSLQQFSILSYDEDLGALAWAKAIENRLHHGKNVEVIELQDSVKNLHHELSRQKCKETETPLTFSTSGCKLEHLDVVESNVGCWRLYWQRLKKLIQKLEITSDI